MTHYLEPIGKRDWKTSLLRLEGKRANNCLTTLFTLFFKSFYKFTLFRLVFPGKLTGDFCLINESDNVCQTICASYLWWNKKG